jgi:methylene-fatty-acyl-phospholipid synthase
MLTPGLFYPLAFCLLGIERVLYGYVFHYPAHFIKRCQAGTFGKSIQAEERMWKNFMMLHVYVKVFQVSVILYDIFVFSYPWKEFDIKMFGTGLGLVLAGQALNASVYKALGQVGVYYGHELGYKVPFVTAFPYNLGISDPQYWGVLTCIWGIYIALGIPSLVICYMEVFWYLMSMKLIENQRGGELLRFLHLKD